MGKFVFANQLVWFVTVCLFASVPKVFAASDVAQVPFFEGFETGTFESYWAVNGTANYLTEITSGYGPATGGKHLVMACKSDGTYSRNEATLTVDLSNYGNVVLSYDAREYGDEAHGAPSYPFVDHANFDGIAVSADGINWYEVASMRSLSSVYTAHTVDLDAAVSAAGIAYNATFKIRFNQYDNYALTTDGIGIDNVAITGDLLDDLSIGPRTPQTFSGYENGPFTPSDLVFNLNNISFNPLQWTVSSTPWLICSSTGGVLPVGSCVQVEVSFDSAVMGWDIGNYDASIVFRNESSGYEQEIPVSLDI